MKRFLIFAILALPAVLPLESFIEKPSSEGIAADTICFSRDILPMLNSNCAMSGCHDASAAGGFKLTTAAGVLKGVKAGSPSTSSIYREINSGSMPRSPWKRLPDSLKTRLSAWITAGAKTAECVEAFCDTSNVTYAKDIKPIIQTACVGCHQTTSAEGGFHMDVDATNQENKVRIYESAAHINGAAAMPRNIAQLSACQIAKLRIWALGTSEVANDPSADDAFSIVQDNGEEVLRFQLALSTQASVNVYSADGRVITSIPSSVYAAGYNQVRLGTSMQAHGLYFVRFVSQGTTRSMKFLR